jgi:F420-dependent oxidoreductase-like protein
MELGLQLNKFDGPGGPAAVGPRFVERVRWAEESGFSTLWMMDHLFMIQALGPAEEDILEVFSALSYAAAITSKIKLGQMVVGITYRNPALLVKMATTLDVLAGGRTYLGVGAAWFEREHTGYGIEFPPLKERFERLEETIQIALQMWSDNNGPYNGAHFQLAETINNPLPLSQPHPSLMIGGSGEQKTLRMVAQYADACNIGASGGVEVVAHKLQVLRDHCERLGRDYATIEKTTLGGILPLSNSGKDGTMSGQQAIDMLGKLADLGVDHAIIGIGMVDAPDSRRILVEEVLPAAKALKVAGR